MSEKIKENLDDIINHKKIKTVFQPIISLRDGSILGHEALSRITCDSAFENIGGLFKYATLYNCLWELELLCRTTALEAAYKFMIPPYNKKLFLNVDPNIMHDESFQKGFTKGFLEQFEIIPGNIIFEITERNVINDFNGFISTIDHYKGQNYKIAIDDAGAGYSGLNLISGINPHYIKLDMNLVRGVDADKLKYALIKGMVEVSKVSNISLIAEGIETYRELETLLNLGVQYGQGYLIQKPNEKVIEINPRIQCHIINLNKKKIVMKNYSISDIHIKHLSTATDIVNPNEKVSTIYDFFNAHTNHFGLCVIENGIPVGIITSEKLSLILSGQFGFTLHQNKHISEIMDKDFLKVGLNLSVNEVSSIAMARPNNKLYDFIVVTDNDKYFGTVTIKDLLQKTTEIEIISAKHQNPLSGLPGNLIIEQQLVQCLADSVKRSIAYIDIDNFKAYNDYYGFEKGDMIIKLLAEIISTSFPNQFVGHIGGDDFVVILDRAVEHSYFDDMKIQFEADVLNYYNDKDKNNGYIVVNNRQYKLEKFPLMTITCVVTNNKIQDFNNVYDLSEHLSVLKRNAKQYKI